jgi:hypothetical protein
MVLKPDAKPGIHDLQAAPSKAYLVLDAMRHDENTTGIPAYPVSID